MNGCLERCVACLMVKAAAKMNWPSWLLAAALGLSLLVGCLAALALPPRCKSKRGVANTAPSQEPCSPTRPCRCPRTHARAERPHRLRVGAKCYEVLTCSAECADELQRLAEASEAAFLSKYEVSGTADAAGLHLHHHVTRRPAQIAAEVPCGCDDG